MKQMINIALPKGRLGEKAYGILEAAGFECPSIKEQNRKIYAELKQANQTLSGIKSSLKEIEKSNARIEHNTAITATAAQQTNDAVRWMAWRTWANGY